jgi:Domain of unknown function (DUF4260)
MTTGDVVGSVRSWLRTEGLAVLLLATWMYADGGHSWILFAVLFFVPDVSFAGYIWGPRAGAVVYNSAHSYLGPIALGVAMLATGRAPTLAIIWAAHVGFDRALGYGLKYSTGFGDTHLGRIGRPERP